MSNFSITLKTLKIILFEWKFAIGIYLAITVLITTFQTFVQRTHTLEFIEIYHASITIPNLIFIFILGITAFAETFRLAASFNISRRLYFFAQSLALFLTGAALALLDSGFAILLTEASGIRFWHPIVSIPYLSGQTANIVFLTASLNIMSAFAGWFIRLLYYRADKLQKILLSISCAFLFFFFIAPENRLSASLNIDLQNGTEWLAYLTVNISNTIIITLSSSLLFAVLCYLIIRSTPVK